MSFSPEISINIMELSALLKKNPGLSGAVSARVNSCIATLQRLKTIELDAKVDKQDVLINRLLENYTALLTTGQ